MGNMKRIRDCTVEIGSPLEWPPGWARTAAGDRRRSSFRVSLARARDELIDELEKFGATHVVLSTNKPVKRNGTFFANAREPIDTGVAVTFQLRGKPHVIACDAYDQLRFNVRALGATIAAMRTIERHGASQLLERAVSGFAALPAGEDEPEAAAFRAWWEVLCVPSMDGSTPREIAQDPSHPLRDVLFQLVRTVYRRHVQEAHPDRGGSSSSMAELNAAWEAAQEALR